MSSELVIERAALRADGDTILPEHLPDLAAEMQARTRDSASKE